MKFKITLLLFFILTISYALVMKTLEKESEATVTYNATGQISERRSGKMVILELDDSSENKLVDFLEIHSNIFSLGDEVDVEYYQTGNNFFISEIKPVLRSETDRVNLANKIISDPTMIRFQEQINRNNENQSELSKILAFPDKIKGQKYVMFKPEEFFRYINYSYTNQVIIQNEEVQINGDNSFNVISFENYYENEYHKIEYSYVDNFDKDKIIFKGLGRGIYLLKLEYKNGNVIDYIFI